MSIGNVINLSLSLLLSVLNCYTQEGVLVLGSVYRKILQIWYLLNCLFDEFPF